MPVLLLIVGLIVIAVAIYAAMGRGGEMAAERADYKPLDLGPVSAADVALLRPPTGGWGYDKNVTDVALEQIAESIRERDVRIVALEQLVTDLSRNPDPVPLGDPIPGARHRRSEPPAAPPAAPPPAGSVRDGAVRDETVPYEAVRDEAVQDEPEAPAPDSDADAFADTDPTIPVVHPAPGPVAAEPVPRTRMKPVGPPMPWPQDPAQGQSEGQSERQGEGHSERQGQDRADPFAARSEELSDSETAQPRERVRERSRQQPPPERSHG